MNYSTHSDRLERWLGAQHVEQMSRNFRTWYGPPVAVAGVPGRVFVTGGGDFIGECRVGAELSAVERGMGIVREESRRRYKRFRDKERGSFSSLSAAIAAATGGKQCRMLFQKLTAAPTAALGCTDTWMCGPSPAAGAAGGAIASAPTVTTSATTGALPFANAVANANTSHFVNAWLTANFVNSLLLVDQLFRAAYAVATGGSQTVYNNSAANWARYQSSTATDPSYAGGTFVYPAVTGTLLPATAHNWTSCTYYNQANSGPNTIPTIAGITSCAKWQIDLLLGSWFFPLASGDTGVFKLQNCAFGMSATPASGTCDIVAAHPIAVLPLTIANMVSIIDGLTTAFNLVQVYDNACLNFLELPKPATNATTYSGQINTVSE